MEEYCGDYILEISSNTPIQNVWLLFREKNVTFIKLPRHGVFKNGNKFLDLPEISNILG